MNSNSTGKSVQGRKRNYDSNNNQRVKKKIAIRGTWRLFASSFVILAKEAAKQNQVFQRALAAIKQQEQRGSFENNQQQQEQHFATAVAVVRKRVEVSLDWRSKLRKTLDDAECDIDGTEEKAMELRRMMICSGSVGLKRKNKK